MGMDSDAGQWNGRRNARWCGRRPQPAEGSVTPRFPRPRAAGEEGSAGVTLPTVCS